jgi:hypothetical protein
MYNLTIPNLSRPLLHRRWSTEPALITKRLEIARKRLYNAHSSRLVPHIVHTTQVGEDGPGNYDILITLRDFTSLAVRKAILEADDCLNATLTVASWTRSTSLIVGNNPEDVEQPFRKYHTVSTRLPYVHTSKFLMRPLEHCDGHTVIPAEDSPPVVHDNSVRNLPEDYSFQSYFYPLWRPCMEGADNINGGKARSRCYRG